MKIADNNAVLLRRLKMYDLMRRNGLDLVFPRSANNWFDHMFRPLDYAWSPFNKDENGDYVGEFDVPGFGDGDINILVEDGLMKISGDKGDRSINYSVTIPDGIDTNTADATIKNGILSIRLPIAEEAKPKKIEVK